MANSIIAAVLLGFTFVTGDLLGIPTLPFDESGDYFELSSLSGIKVDTKHCEDTDTNGHTLIPPTLLEFTNTFASDLEATGCHTKVNIGDAAGHGDVFVTIGNNSEFVDAAGRWTAEAYSLNVSTEGITITGASPLGAWWATRSILQQAALNNGSIPTGYGVDAPGWGTRGIMVRSVLSRNYNRISHTDFLSSTVVAITTHQSSSSSSALGSRTGRRTCSTSIFPITSTTTPTTLTSSRWSSTPGLDCGLTIRE